MGLRAPESGPVYVYALYADAYARNVGARSAGASAQLLMPAEESRKQIP